MREEQRSVVAEFRSESMRGADEAGYLGDGSNDAVGDRERAAYFARVMERD
jgi:hypothetical protein